MATYNEMMEAYFAKGGTVTKIEAKKPVEVERANKSTDTRQVDPVTGERIPHRSGFDLNFGGAESHF